MDNQTVNQNIFEEFCGSPFWDLNITWNTDNPDFTKCFQKTALIWFPCGFLWLLSPLELYYIACSKNRNIPWTFLNVLKFLLMIPLIFATIFDFYHTISLNLSGEKVFPVDYSAPIIRLISFLLYLLLLKCNLKKGYRTSGILFLFWLILVLCESVQLRSLLQNPPFKSSGLATSFILFMVYYALIVVQLILNCFADAAPKILYHPSVKKPSPEVESSFLCKISFSWFDAFLWKGFRKSLDMEDLWDISFEDSSKNIVSYFYKYWPMSLEQDNLENEKNPKKQGRESDPEKRFKKRKPISIVPAMCKVFGPLFFFGSVLRLIQDILGFTSPQILSALIGFVESDDYQWKGYFYASLMFFASLIQSIFLSQYFYWILRIGMRMRTALTSAIYRKALRLSNAARRQSTVGEIVNLMSVDVHRFVELTLHINLFWSAPFQMALALYFLWQILGVASLAGLAVLLLLIPTNILIAHHVKKLQIKQMKHKDERVKIVNEVLNGMKVLKLYAWEPSFENQVTNVRNKELRVLKRSAYLSSEFQLLWTCVPFLVSLATFATFIFINEDNVLDSKTAFVSIALFEMLRLPLGLFPAMITNFLQARVSIQRLNKFMNMEEIDPNKIEHNKDEIDPVVVEKGDFSWEEGKDATLNDINLRIKEGHLVAIVGSVGSGKSSLISALLGEMEKINGRVNIKGTISYVPQQAWIQNVSLRDNILFGQKLDKKAFKRVINACALRPDIGVLPSGVDTEIGEKGINLSGGQKQRVSLARAIYCNADIYLLDDPLSAVDSHVGKHIFENVIGPNGLLKKKTRILVTHGITFLPEVDEIIVMNEGRIIEQGNYEELLERKGAFAEVLINHLQQSLHGDSNQEEDIEEIVKILRSKMETGQYKEFSSQISRISNCSSNTELQGSRPTLYRTISGDSAVSEESVASQITTSKEDLVVDKLIESEKAETGKVKWKVYFLYVKSFGIHLLLATFLFSLTYEGFSVGSKFWLSYWSSDQDSGADAHQRNIFLGVYGGMGIGVALTAYLRDLASRLGCWHAGRNLHTMLLKGVLRAPMSFFDTTPLGRIIARFARDLDGLDSFMPYIISDLINNIFTVLATLFVISYNTPMFLVVVLPIAIVYYFIQQFYIATSRQLKRLESVSRSPIFSHFAESISGAPFIRAFGVQDRFIKENEEKVDKSQMCFYPTIAARRWLSLRLELLGNLVIFFASLFAVMGKQSLTPGAVGLSVSNAFLITRILTWLVRTSSELETNIVAAERIKEYGDTKPEAAWENFTSLLPKEWPTEGKVEFKNFHVCYREGLNMVLKDLTFTVQGGEKIGIVGRTGAGKSSLTLSLFRIIEPADGKIIIDGIDITTLGLHALRGRLTVIPQDPVLFSGTLRMNLDPFDKYSDNEIWAALEHAHLRSFVKSIPAGLQHEVSEEGENLSVGQRQLVCLARALLRKTKVLVLDEATAAVDLETDELIQATIRSEFKDCTIFTIAHRLNTIMDSDRVIVLDNGRMVEYGSPAQLLNKKNSLFSKMAKDAGII